MKAARVLEDDDVVEVEASKVLTLRVTSVRPFSGQPRQHFDKDRLRELAASLKEFGQQVAIIVRKLPAGAGHGYEVIDGERRWHACQMAGIKTIRAEVRGARDNDHQFVQSVVANFGREEHTPLEAGLAVARVAAMPEYSTLTPSQRNERIGALFARSAMWAQLYLRMMTLPPEVLERVGKRELNAQVAQLLVSLHDQADQKRLATEIVKKKLKPPQARLLIRGALGDTGTGRKPSRDLDLVFNNVEKVKRFATATLELPRKGFVQTLDARPGSATALRGRVREAIDALEELDQALARCEPRKGRG